MRYFIEDVRLYKPINKKWEDVQKFVTPLMQYLVADENTLNKVNENIMNHIELLNKVYPRSLPLVLTVSRNPTGRVWRIGVQDGSDKIAAMIYIREVRGHIHLYLQDGETLEFAPDTDEERASKERGSRLQPTR